MFDVGQTKIVIHFFSHVKCLNLKSRFFFRSTNRTTYCNCSFSLYEHVIHCAHALKYRGNEQCTAILQIFNYVLCDVYLDRKMKTAAQLWKNPLFITAHVNILFAE